MFGDACWARKILQVLLGRLDHPMVCAQHRPRALTRGQGQPLRPVGAHRHVAVVMLRTVRTTDNRPQETRQHPGKITHPR